MVTDSLDLAIHCACCHRHGAHAEIDEVSVGKAQALRIQIRSLLQLALISAGWLERNDGEFRCPQCKDSL